MRGFCRIGGKLYCLPAAISAPPFTSYALPYVLPEAPPAPAGLAAAAEKDRTAAGRGRHLAAAVRRAISKILSQVCNETEREGHTTVKEALL